MNRLLILTASLLIAAPVAAEHVYGGLAKGNPDIEQHPEQPAPVGTPSKEESVSRTVYDGLAKGNPDLVGERAPSEGPTSRNPDIYQAAQPNPDLSY
jgi:hypothetical protein